ncbi:hypothetical protein MLAC_18470 [Mycobacterium lacus]|uniref:Uncharacterized protein n=1 Tax=Mycobacterium lacus TaxID=169765 RepID=A0A7I7NJR9_9MYCO|nr:hypothetical protein MLAC_18470 [Mycobacterium lacus]
MIAGGCDFLCPHNFCCHLLGGVDGAYAVAAAQLYLVMVQDGAVSAVSFREDPADGGRRH